MSTNSSRLILFSWQMHSQYSWSSVGHNSRFYSPTTTHGGCDGLVVVGFVIQKPMLRGRIHGSRWAPLELPNLAINQRIIDIRNCAGSFQLQNHYFIMNGGRSSGEKGGTLLSREIYCRQIWKQLSPEPQQQQFPTFHLSQCIWSRVFTGVCVYYTNTDKTDNK